jgi:hypothetical protein
MDFSELTPYLPYIWLAGSLIGALLVDWIVVRLLTEVIRPPSAYIFWIGRAGKLAAVILWILFFNNYWYPQFVAHGESVPKMLTAGEIGCVGALVMLAIATLPRNPHGRRGSDA